MNKLLISVHLEKAGKAILTSRCSVQLPGAARLSLPLRKRLIPAMQQRLMFPGKASNRHYLLVLLKYTCLKLSGQLPLPHVEKLFKKYF